MLLAHLECPHRALYPQSIGVVTLFPLWYVGLMVVVRIQLGLGMKGIRPVTLDLAGSAGSVPRSRIQTVP